MWASLSLDWGKFPVSSRNLGNKCGMQVESSNQGDTVGRFPLSGL